MTQTLANRMTTAPDPVFVACSPLQPQEKMLEGNQMAEVHGGIPPLIVAAAPYVATFVAGVATTVVAGLILDELTSEESDNTDVTVNVNVSCNCNSGN